MKKLLTIALLALSLNALAGTVTVTSSDIAGKFLNNTAVSFNTGEDFKFVIECNDSYGLMGLSDVNYIAYNRINPAIELSATECTDMLDSVDAGKSVTFSWEKTNNCNYLTCQYILDYKVN